METRPCWPPDSFHTPLADGLAQAVGHLPELRLELGNPGHFPDMLIGLGGLPVGGDGSAQGNVIQD